MLILKLLLDYNARQALCKLFLTFFKVVFEDVSIALLCL